ncbi:MAG: amino acid adenylation domain-containing protein, partial [Thermoanaerobaculia bacterium]
ARVAETPEAPALEWGVERWSYERLAKRASRLAAALVRRGVGAGRLVALRLPQLPDLVTAMLAVHEAGGAFLVLDALDTPDRIARILAATRPLLAIGDSGLHHLAPQMPELPVHPVDLADGLEISPARLAADSRPAARAWDLAYVAMTSGSTGAPKGVAVEHGALAHYIGAAGREFALSPSDRVLQLGSPAFDLALEQIFGALCHGATLVAFAEQGLPAPRELIARCSELGITVLDLPTAVWEQAAMEVEAHDLALPATLRLLVLGGELASVRAARVWLDASGGRRLVNTYGPTEATIVATWWNAPHRSADIEEGDGLPIGHPVDGVWAVVLDPVRQPVAPGEAGELWLGGCALARGYHLRPDLTAARFSALDMSDAADPLPGGEIFYATGDRARRRPDGELEFLGRLDRQVKIAGRRVEPGEVEATLRAIAGVAAAAVAPLQMVAGGRHLRGWVVLEPGAALAAVTHESTLRLPAFLRPRPLVAVAALPLTRAGKVDFDRLVRESVAPLASPPNLPGGEAAVAVNSDELEPRLAKIWELLLGRYASSPLPRDADFFALGGDSLAAVSLLIEIESVFGVHLRVAELLRSPTLGSLAGELRVRMAAGSGRAAVSSLVEIVPPVVPAAPEGPTIFCVHGLGGHLLRLVALARALAPGRRLVGLQSPGLDDDRPIPHTIEELAHSFLAEIRAQPLPAPYRLAGMSFGGVVAYEMAQQAGPGEILWVAMFDTELGEVLPGFRPAPWSSKARNFDRLRRLGGDLLGRLRRFFRRIVAGRDDVLKANEYRHFTRVLRANEAALANYLPGPWNGEVTFLAATPRPAGLYEEFTHQTGCRLAMVPVPGDHLSMLEPPHVDTLAAELERLR